MQVYRLTRINNIIVGVLLLAILLSQSAAALPDTYEKIATTVSNVICDFYNVFWSVIGVLGVVVILAAGVEWVLSRDDPGKRKMAQSIIIAVIIGLLIAAITKTLLNSISTSVASGVNEGSGYSIFSTCK